MKTALEKRIEALEKLALVSVPGTVIQRVLVDTTILVKEGLTIREDKLGRNYRIVWSVGIGEIQQPKVFAYGYDLKEALDRVDRKITELRVRRGREYEKAIRTEER